jgi:hypothetical protein
VKLTWISRKEWGPVGNTHRCKVEIDGQSWHFAIAKPSGSSPWVLRGWLDGESAAYREGRTLAELKDLAHHIATKG